MASELGQEVIRKVVDVLKKKALIMGPDHMLVLGRGPASFKRLLAALSKFSTRTLTSKTCM